jgi:hypothetical protein
LNIIQYARKILHFFSIQVFSASVSKPRSPGQTLIAIALDEQLLAAIDRRRGTVNRSAFIRESLVKYLGVPIILSASPDRAGKGGRPKKYSSEDPAEVPSEQQRIAVLQQLQQRQQQIQQEAQRKKAGLPPLSKVAEDEKTYPTKGEEP